MCKLTVYSKNNCPECVKATTFLDTNDIPYETVKIDMQPEAREFLISKGHKAVPQIYLGNYLFVEGGFRGLQTMGAKAIKFSLQCAEDIDRHYEETGN